MRQTSEILKRAVSFDPRRILERVASMDETNEARRKLARKRAAGVAEAAKAARPEGLKGHVAAKMPPKPVEIKPALEADPTRWPLPGIAPMTRIRTSFGEVHAIALRKGDLVKTRSGDFRPIVWLDRVKLDEKFLSGMPDAHPVMLKAGSAGSNCPSRDIMLSPRQQIAPTPQLRLNGACEAADLLSRPGVMRRPETGLSYTMFHLGEPAEVFCEGMLIRVSPQ